MTCKAYVKETLNPLVGDDQHYFRFAKEITLWMELFVPSGVDDGTYHLRGDRIYPYLRNIIFPKFQKFNKVLRLVHACSPTCVTENEIITTEVAIHMWVATTMEYSHNNYDPTKWNLYSGRSAVKHLPKFSYVRAAESEDSEVGGVARNDRPVMGRPQH